MGIILGLLIVYLIIWGICFVFSECHYISFHKFFKYYTIDPEKWNLESLHVWPISATSFAFGPVGTILYVIWHLNHSRKEINEELEEMFGGNHENS